MTWKHRSLTTPPLARAPRDEITACDQVPHSDHRTIRPRKANLDLNCIDPITLVANSFAVWTHGSRYSRSNASRCREHNREHRAQNHTKGQNHKLRPVQASKPGALHLSLMALGEGSGSSFLYSVLGLYSWPWPWPRPSNFRALPQLVEHCPKYQALPRIVDHCPPY